MRRVLILCLYLCLFLSFSTVCYAGGPWYVKWDTGNDTTGNGLSWATAYKTISKAHTSASNGDTINISGGATGLTYAENLALTKTVTIQGSTEAEHNGQVTLSSGAAAGIYFNAASGTITLNNIHHTHTGTFSYPLDFNGTCAAVLNNYHLDHAYTTNRKLHTVSGSAVTMNFSTFRDSYQDASLGTSTWGDVAAGASLTLNYCQFLTASGIITVSGTLTAYNTLFEYSNPFSTSSSPYAILVNATGNLTSKNNIYIGQVPVSSVSGATIVSDHDYWHQSKIGAPQEQTTFDSANLATVTNSIQYLPPLFRNGRGSTMGDLIIMVDDENNLGSAYTFAHDYASGTPVKVSMAMNTGQEYVTGGWTATKVDQLRWLINHGHEVASHSATHSGFGTLNGITASWTGGTSKSITITGTRTGDSSTWSGSLKLTVDGTDCPDASGIDLSSSSYNTLGEVITWLNGRVCNGASLAATKTSTNIQTSLNSLILADASLSGNGTLLLNETALVRVEAIESILDLEAYINSGTDRNGAHGVTPNEPAPDPAYVMHTFRTPYGIGSAALKSELLNDPGGLHDIWGGLQIDAGSAKTWDLWRFGNASDSLFDVYMFEYEQGMLSNRIFAAMATTTVAPVIFNALYHGAPGYGTGNVGQNLVDLCVAMNTCTRTLTDVLTMIRTSGDFTDQGNGVWLFTGDPSKYLWRGDYHLQITSPLIYSGTDVGLTSDFDSKPIRGATPNIGCYESWPGIL